MSGDILWHMPGGKEEISWSVGTHEHRERSADWYWTLGVAAVVSAGLSIFLGNFLFAVIILIAAGSIGTLSARGPREHSVKINRRGISIDGTLYPYQGVRSFWVEREGDNSRLFLSMSGLVSPHFNLALQNEARGVEVEQYLKRFVDEEEQVPTVGERLAELFGL